MVPVDVIEHPDARVSIQPWTAGPRHPHLPSGAVDVWRVDLADVSDDLLALLSADEQTRAERMARHEARALWARSRGVLRALLGSYLQADPRELTFAVGRAGKPSLEDPPDANTAAHATPGKLCFNLSHSGQVGLYAFTRVGAVGVDVEVARRPIDAIALAERFLDPAAAARVRSLEPERRDQEFRRAWVRHEATLKCVGAGLGGSRDQESAHWISELDMGTQAAGAVAMAVSPTALRCWDWSARISRS